jgi:hypothetical protein
MKVQLGTRRRCRAFATHVRARTRPGLISERDSNRNGQDIRVWVRIFCDGEKLIDSAKLIALELSRSMASGHVYGRQRRPRSERRL